ncbi:maleylacetoacetate isomerase [Sneathiella chinensis]|uniref:Maleylacetoacetate isomerase n=1 Tax=Sneathiella chinensis TaxID=349750 RepID=A0ABQ5U2P4_9PROT|nr:maleylacetoacetate isomerase [Sneathiella chinensis]GLQ06352.1 maleylacetoacetate isomerase [Sneathiella chinensis]
MSLRLFGYWRSSASYRVRIALNLKGLGWKHQGVHLLRDGGEQLKADYAHLNPQKLVPTLVADGVPLTQSLAILEYLEEAYPDPPLLPEDLAGRARVRAIAAAIACDIHPLDNLRVLRYMKNALDSDETARNRWYAHWITEGFNALEITLGASETGQFCHGDQPTFADCCLVPQVYNARRFHIDMTPYPEICRIEQACLGLPAFDLARPEQQPDCED